ncbi:MAG: 30S ribosomal protein S8 [Clostridia bacterium]|nr:30S ribosomal protein S8 [Clostridia bacterium]MDD4798500.1 30S ribosomal protein S8 [Clostridia bacterium]
MVVTDPIADFLTRIRNANMVYMDKVEIPASKTKMGLAKIMKEEGFIKDVEYVEDGKQGIIRVYLKYGNSKERVVTGLKRISRPGLRVYARKDELPKVLGGLGIAVISTSSGLMTDKNARKQGLGGEVLCYIW